MTKLGEVFVYPDFLVVDGVVAPGAESIILPRSGVTFDPEYDVRVLCIRENKDYAGELACRGGYGNRRGHERLTGRWDA